ncbi:MAG: DMT family transporter [Lachnospiraceae bacterium]
MTKAKIQFILSMLLFGTIGIFVRWISLPSSVIALARGGIGAVFLLAVMFVQKKSISKEAVKRNGIVLFLSGIFLGVNWILLFEAYRYITVATATLCYYMAPIIVMLLSPLLLGEKMTAKKGICAAMAFIGIYLIFGMSESGIDASANPTGILCGIGAAAFYAGVMMLNKKLKDISAYDRTFIQLGTASLVLLPYTIMTEKISELTFTGRSVLLLVVVGILHTGITYLLYFSAMKTLRVQTAAILSYIDPVTAVLLSVLLLGEKMNISGGIGAVLILGSAFVSEGFFNRG